jgi:ribulose-5-phosphate 4-epimerase/fuculose-1-phosphate aldolase
MLDVVEKKAKPGRKDRVSIYQPEQEGLEFPELPSFDNPAAERRHLKERLVAACRAFHLHGFDYGFAGHISVRDPEHPQLYWTNPMAVAFDQVKLSNLVCADHKGTVVEGTHALNRAGFVLHAAIHEHNPDIVAVCHAHTVYGTAFAALGEPLAMISQDACAFHDDHAVVTESAGAVTVQEGSGDPISDAFAKVRAVVHQNHGLLTCSRHSVDDAAFWFIALERVCQQQLAVEATGRTPKRVTTESAAHSREHVGNDFIGWLHFQTIWNDLVATQPDMFD